MFGRRKKQTQETRSYDKTQKIPIIRASICTGEQIAGFKDKTSGQFEEVMFLRTPADLQDFLRLYGISEAEIKREW